MLNTSFSPWPSFTDEEIAAVNNVLTSNKVNYWTGDECKAFEQEFAEWSDCKYAIAVANGTLALELALKALGVGDGDEVIVPPRTFLATASAVVAVGGVPVFADVDEDSQNISPDSICSVVSRKTKAIICVHLAGMPCDMDEIMHIAEERGLKVIEDCAQAHGARYKGRSVGSIGHMGAWSFCQDKIMTTGGEGGMVTTNNEKLWRSSWSYKDHGKSYEAVFEREHPSGFRWLHEAFGSNYRMTEMQAAIGRIQLKRMACWTSARTDHALKIASACNKVAGLYLPEIPKSVVHAYYKFYTFALPHMFKQGWDRDRFVAEMNAKGVPCYQGSCSEIYLEKAFDDTGWRPKGALPVAKALGENSIMFLVHPTLTDEEIEITCQAIIEVGSEAF